jgi:PilZ domain
MQKFEYRAPRYLVDLPVVLTLQEGSFSGRCKEISKDGMRMELLQPVTPGASGTVRVTYNEYSIELRVTVAHSGAKFDGLKFLFESDKDRSTVERLVSLLAASTSSQPDPAQVRKMLH